MASRLLPVLALQPAGVEATLTLSTFAPIGYTDNGVAPNFVRVEYDADASPLELRMSASGDEPSFFDALAARLGELSTANGGAAVVLVGHSVSNCVASSFLRWAAATKGRAWVDGAVYSWVAFAAPLLGTAECARRLLKGEVAATAAPESSVVTKVAPPAASAAIAALDRSAPSAAWLVPRGAWARRTSLGAFWLRDESVLRIQIGKVEVQRWAVVHKPTGRDTGDGPALYLEVDVNGSRIACAPTKSYEPVFNFAVQSVLLSQGGAGVEDVAPNVVTIILKKRTTVGSSTVATAVLDLAALLGPSIAATSGPAGAVAAGAAVTLTAGDGAEETASAAALAGSGLAAVVGLSSPARGASLSPRAGERGAFADGGADAASPAEGDADVATEGIADGALAYNSAAYEGLVAFEGLAIRKQAYGSQQAVAPATMRLSLAWRRSASGDTEQHVRPSLWASLDEATSTTSVTANPRTSDVVARFSGPSYLADPAFGGIPATAIPRGREINRREERSLKPMATECLETQFALAESDVAPPPLKRVVAVYGVNTPTAVQYAFKHKHMHALRTPGVLPWEPSTSLDGVSGDGVVYESEACGRLALRVDTGERVATSGDGVVPYLSLRHAASWHGARALGARELCNVQVLELPGASHDDVVSDARAAAFLARYLAPTISVEVPASELLGAHAAGRKAEQLYLTLTLLDAEGEALEPAVRSSLATAGALPSEPIVVGGYCDVETATSMTLELCSRVSSVPLASVSLDVAEVLYRTNTPTLTAWEAWHDLDLAAAHDERQMDGAATVDGRLQLRVTYVGRGASSDGRLVKKLANSSAMGAASTPAIASALTTPTVAVEAFEETPAAVGGVLVSGVMAEDAAVRRAYTIAKGGGPSQTRMEAQARLAAALVTLGVTSLELVGLPKLDELSDSVDPDKVAALTTSFSAFAAAYNAAAALVDEDLARRFRRFVAKKGELRSQAIGDCLFVARDSHGAGRLLFDSESVVDVGTDECRMVDAAQSTTPYELVVFGPFEQANNTARDSDCKVTDAVVDLIAQRAAKLPKERRLPYTVVSSFETLRSAFPAPAVPPFVFCADAENGAVRLIGGLLELRAFFAEEAGERAGASTALSRTTQLTVQAALDEAERSCLRFGVVFA